MVATMSERDMKTTRNVLRWAAVGAQPNKENATAAMDLIKSLDPKATATVSRTLDEIKRGILVSQEVCNQALSQLQAVYKSPQDDDIERGEVSRG